MRVKLRRSMIEVPGHESEMLAAARKWDADVLMLDLEDSVPNSPSTKDAARAGVKTWLTNPTWRARSIALRVNRPMSRWFLDDITLASQCKIDTVVLPKAYGANDVLFAERALDLRDPDRTISMMLIVETPHLLLELQEVAGRTRRIDGLVGGSADYTLETGCFAFVAPNTEDLDDSHLVYNRQKVLAVARAHGWSALDGLLVRDETDLELAKAVATKARHMGFDGCTMFYPAHIGLANQIFSPNAQELDWAERAISSYEARGEDGEPLGAMGSRSIEPFHYNLALDIRQRSELAAEPDP